MTPRTITGALAALGLIGAAVIANYLTTRFGFVSVGFGLVATAGTFAAGFALGFRDLVHDLLGRTAVVVAVIIGAALSYLVADPQIALASGAAFLIAELADFAVYTPLRRRGRIGGGRWSLAVAASNAVGAVVDTAVFLGIAFGWSTITAPVMAGQLVGKGWTTLALIVLVGGGSRALLRQPEHAAGA
jgi:hypothetical protein